jgi:hypothetical protein
MVLRIDRCLQGAANDSGTASHHGTSVWIGQSDLFIRLLVELDFNRLKHIHLGF